MDVMLAAAIFARHWREAFTGVLNGLARAKQNKNPSILIVNCKIVDSATGEVVCRQRRPVYIPPAS